MEIVFKRKRNIIKIVFGSIIGLTFIIHSFINLYLSNLFIFPLYFLAGVLFIYLGYFISLSPYIRITKNQIIIYRYPFFYKYIKLKDFDKYYQVSKSESVIIQKNGERYLLKLRLLDENMDKKELDKAFQELNKK